MSSLETHFRISFVRHFEKILTPPPSIAHSDMQQNAKTTAQEIGAVQATQQQQQPIKVQHITATHHQNIMRMRQMQQLAALKLKESNAIKQQAVVMPQLLKTTSQQSSKSQQQVGAVQHDNGVAMRRRAKMQQQKQDGALSQKRKRGRPKCEDKTYSISKAKKMRVMTSSEAVLQVFFINFFFIIGKKSN